MQDVQEHEINKEDIQFKLKMLVSADPKLMMQSEYIDQPSMEQSSSISEVDKHMNFNKEYEVSFMLDNDDPKKPDESMVFLSCHEVVDKEN